MAAQVIVKLIADPSGLVPGVEALEALGQIDKATADEFKATNKAFQDRAKVLNTTNTSTEKLATASKNLVESITGGAITQATQNIERLGAEIAASNADTIAFTKTVELAKQKLSTLREGTAEFDKLSNEIAAAELAMGNFADEATSSRGRLRQYRETLLQLEDAGLAGTQVFEDMAEAAGELQDQVGDTSARIQALASDTFALDAGVQVIQGVAGAFSIAQGAAALFGDENKDLQQALLKVNAAMAILQGITQVQTILQSETSASIAVGIALQRIQALSTNLQAAAESRFIIVRYAAIVAQKALNLAMALNPAGALLLTISAVAGALLYFTSNTDDAAESNENLSKELDNQNQVLKLNSAAFERNTALRVAEAKATGALASTISKIEKEGLKSRAKDLAENIKLNQKRFDNIIKTDDEIIAINKQLDADQEELRNLNNQGKIKEIEIQRTLADEANKSATASAQARIAQAKKDSQAELNASIAAIRVRQREELAAEGLTQGERELIVANNERAISQLVLQIQQKRLDDQIALAQANAIEQTDGYRKLEADIQVIILKAQKDTLGKSKEQAILIEAEKNQAIKNLRKQLFKDLEEIETESTFKISQKAIAVAEKGLQQSHAFQKKALTQFLEDKNNSYTKDFDQRNVLQNIEKEKEIAIDQARIDSIGANADERVLIEQDLQRKLTKLNKDAEQERLAQRQAVFDAGVALAQSLSNSLQTINKNRSDAELAVISDQREKELNLLKKRLDAKQITQEEYDRLSLATQEKLDQKIKIIKTRQAIQDRQFAIFQATINAAAAIVKVFQTTGPPLSFILAATTAAATLAQIAAIKSQPLPAFKKGTRSKPTDGFGLIGEAGPELFQINGKWGYAAGPMVLDMPKGSKVIPTLETDKIMQKYNIAMPQMPAHLEVANGYKIDYSKMAKFIGRELGHEIAKLPLQVNGFDKDGPYEYTTTVQARMNYLKGRYGSR